MTPPALGRRSRPGPAIQLTPLVDVLLILLIFFMVTSTYLDLDMIPMAEPAETPVETAPPADPAAGDAAGSGALLVRLDPAGAAYVAGERLDPPALADAIALRLAERPDAPVLILPSSRAPVQALVDLLGTVRAGGATRVQVVRFETAEGR